MTVYGFIGAGNMVGAIVRGAVAAGLTRGEDAATILLTSPHDSAAELAAQLADPRVEVLTDVSALVRRSEVLVLGVKPQVVPGVLKQVHQELGEHTPLLVSLAAGLALARLESLTPNGTRMVRVMPNLAAAVGESMTAVTANLLATQADVDAVLALMNAVGRTVILEEGHFSAFIGLAGSSPAFVFHFIDDLARAGVMAGIPKAQAVAIVCQAVLGAARMVQAQAPAQTAAGVGRTPADLLDAVCSPGGTTVAGILALEQAGFAAAVAQAFQSVVERDRDLGA
ncbi:Pyrroline-5-carboxylate reductase [Actinomyces bovis]|uniref:Pyrroline-5-carboxylate reductase n=1 Tax=Actinomyces bovis TaxID=1658 RepID=A0ABY1VKP7_9ACTO|nr:pyrroline-5-carboxylate reductase [Actinomyces bovis]SPT52681.1 Pyrroline-5-carboxylate reductase [Actinomyces bovis]VEG54606.1 Pyrroline-5-carboxylate reductase [Actinomyces israelii]